MARSPWEVTEQKKPRRPAGTERDASDRAACSAVHRDPRWGPWLRALGAAPGLEMPLSALFDGGVWWGSH